MHKQQISEFEVLKKFTHAIAAGKDTDNVAGVETGAQSMSGSMSKKSWVEGQLHTSLSKDILLLYKE